MQVGGGQQYIAAFIHSSFKGTRVRVSLHCDADAAFDYTAQLVIRSSPCDKVQPIHLSSIHR